MFETTVELLNNTPYSGDSTVHLLDYTHHSSESMVELLDNTDHGVIQRLNRPTLVNFRLIQPLNQTKIWLGGVIQFDFGMFFLKKGSSAIVLPIIFLAKLPFASAFAI